MDIVVTIPKTEYINNIKEREYQKLNKNSYGFRVLNKLPKQLNVGDRIYFVRDGVIKYSKEVFEININKTEKITKVCDVTGSSFHGEIQICFRNEIDETSTSISCKGFQGFRYKWW